MDIFFIFEHKSMDYLGIFEALNEKKIRYLLCGGLAVNIYGIPRMTADIDIILDFEEQNIDKFESVLKGLNYLKSVPVPLQELAEKAKRLVLIKEKNLIAFSFFNTQANRMSIDVLVDVPIDFSRLWENKTERKVNDFILNVVSMEDLISLKQYAGRAQDLNDIILLSKLK